MMRTCSSFESRFFFVSSPEDEGVLEPAQPLVGARAAPAATEGEEQRDQAALAPSPASVAGSPLISHGLRNEEKESWQTRNPDQGEGLRCTSQGSVGEPCTHLRDIPLPPFIFSHWLALAHLDNCTGFSKLESWDAHPT